MLEREDTALDKVLDLKVRHTNISLQSWRYIVLFVFALSIELHFTVLCNLNFILTRLRILQLCEAVMLILKKTKRLDKRKCRTHFYFD